MRKFIILAAVATSLFSCQETETKKKTILKQDILIQLYF